MFVLFLFCIKLLINRRKHARLLFRVFQIVQGGMENFARDGKILSDNGTLRGSNFDNWNFFQS